MIQNVINCKVIFSESGVSMTPLVASDGGRQGENRATVVKFSIEGLNVENAELTHRVDVVDALGIQHPSKIVTLEVGDYSSIEISHEIERAVTAFGGLVEINAVITAGGKTLKTPALKILFRELKTDDSEILEEANSAFAQLMKLSSAADDYATSARESAEKAEVAKNTAQDFMNSAALNAEAAAEAEKSSFESASDAEESARASSESASQSSTRASESAEARDDAKRYSEQAKAQVDLLRDEWNFTLYEDSPEWILGGSGAYPGYHINKSIKLASGKKYYVKINVKAEADDTVRFFLGYSGEVGRPMTYVDGYYECEFNGFDFEGETKLGWESERGSITATKITISRLDSMAEVLGNIDSALDRIIAIQDSLIGGEG